MARLLHLLLILVLIPSARADNYCYDCNYSPTGLVKVLNGSWVQTKNGIFNHCGLNQYDDAGFVNKWLCSSGTCFVRKEDNGLVFRGCADPWNLPWGVDSSRSCERQGPKYAVWWFCQGDKCNSVDIEIECGDDGLGYPYKEPVTESYVPVYNYYNQVDIPSDDFSFLAEEGESETVHGQEFIDPDRFLDDFYGEKSRGQKSDYDQANNHGTKSGYGETTKYHNVVGAKSEYQPFEHKSHVPVHSKSVSKPDLADTSYTSYKSWHGTQSSSYDPQNKNDNEPESLKASSGSQTDMFYSRRTGGVIYQPGDAQGSRQSKSAAPGTTAYNNQNLHYPFDYYKWWSYILPMYSWYYPDNQGESVGSSTKSQIGILSSPKSYEVASTKSHPTKSHPPVKLYNAPPKTSYAPPSKNSYPPPKSHDPPPKKTHAPPKSYDPVPNESYPPPKSYYPPPKKSHVPPKSYDPLPKIPHPLPKSYDPPPKKSHAPPKSYEPLQKKSHPPPKSHDPPPKKSHVPPKSYDPLPKIPHPLPKSYDPPPKKSHAPPKSYEPLQKKSHPPPKSHDHSPQKSYPTPRFYTPPSTKSYQPSQKSDQSFKTYEMSPKSYRTQRLKSHKPAKLNQPPAPKSHSSTKSFETPGKKSQSFHDVNQHSANSDMRYETDSNYNLYEPDDALNSMSQPFPPFLRYPPPEEPSNPSLTTSLTTSESGSNKSHIPVYKSHYPPDENTDYEDSELDPPLTSTPLAYDQEVPEMYYDDLSYYWDNLDGGPDLTPSNDPALYDDNADSYNPCDGDCYLNPSGLFADPKRADRFIQCAGGMHSSKPCVCCQRVYHFCPDATTFDELTKVCNLATDSSNEDRRYKSVDLDY